MELETLHRGTLIVFITILLTGSHATQYNFYIFNIGTNVGSGS